MNDSLRAELLEMEAADQAPRRLGTKLDQAAMRAAMAADRTRASRLREIVAVHGWPGRALVGDDGTAAAWLVAQHADHDPDLQERMLALLADAVEQGQAEASQWALLTDRVCVNRGRRQIYGTQFSGSGDTFGPLPITDAAGLEARREAVGLEPFAEYEQRIREHEAASRRA